jgi:type-F conjugative transfer system pilin assembly protein TrbC
MGSRERDPREWRRFWVFGVAKKVLLSFVNMEVRRMKIILKKEFLAEELLNLVISKKVIKKAIAVLLLCFLGCLQLANKVEGREMIVEMGLGEIGKAGVKKAMGYEGEVRKYDNPKELELNRKEVNKYVNDATEKAKEYAKESYELKRKSFKGVEEYIKETKLFESAGATNGNNDALGFSDKCRKLVFISLSLSDNNLEDIVRQAKVRGYVPVLRGFKEGSYKKTAYYLGDMMRKTGYGVVIDPESFKEFDVKVVPTFVVAGVRKEGCGNNAEKNDIEGGRCESADYNKIVGNVSFEYVERVFNQSGDKICG